MKSQDPTQVMQNLKDERLDRLANYGNVAQFVSFNPDLKPRYSRISNMAPNWKAAPEAAIPALWSASSEKRINVRSFKPDSPQGNEFIYGIKEPHVAVGKVHELAANGLFTIVNETIDVNDGGVSGVVQDGVIEFAPGGTPRVVDDLRPASVDRGRGLELLRLVYGFTPSLDFPHRFRVEFSVHPIRRGWKSEQTIIWELEELEHQSIAPVIRWPNRFSEFLGDKTFGLLLAHTSGLDVPWSTTISRGVAPFSFGRRTGADVKWLRTCPKVPEPGLFPTVRGWSDPFALVLNTPRHDLIVSLLIQDEVAAQYSGALITDVSGNPIIEGVSGFGDEFMLGRTTPSALDADLISRLSDLHSRLVPDLGSLRLEWAYDGTTIWVLQLQQEAALSDGWTIVEGKPDFEFEFRPSAGLAGLRELVHQVKGSSQGIRVIGSIGITSHIADVLRRHRIPSRIVPE